MIAFIYYSLVLISSIAMCIWFHELGHYLYFFHMIGKKVKISVRRAGLFGFSFFVGNNDDYVGLTDLQYFKLCGWGVLFGFVPMFLLLPFLTFNGLFGFVFWLYILGSVKDIRQMIIYLKEQKGCKK